MAHEQNSEVVHFNMYINVFPCYFNIGWHIQYVCTCWDVCSPCNICDSPSATLYHKGDSLFVIVAYREMACNCMPPQAILLNNLLPYIQWSMAWPGAWSNVRAGSNGIMGTATYSKEYTVLTRLVQMYIITYVCTCTCVCVICASLVHVAGMYYVHINHFSMKDRDLTMNACYTHIPGLSW